MNRSPDIHGICLPTVWRQILCLCVAWIALLVSLIAMPEIIAFTATTFGGLLIVLAVSWSMQGRAASEQQAAPAPRIAS